jgi:hypothetical protein
MKRHTLLATAVAIVCTAATFAQPGTPTVTMVASFETEADNPFSPGKNATATRVTTHATDGRYALRVTAQGSDKPNWPGLWIYPKAAPDWSARQLLVMDVFLETPESVSLGAQLCLLGQKGAKTVMVGRLQPGWNKSLTLDLQEFDADLHRVANLALYLSSPRKPVVYTIDNVRWETSPMHASADGWLNVNDFGASGSDFETTATTAAGSREITVAAVGDLRVGQQVSVSRCNIRFLHTALYGPGEPYATARPLGDAVEIRGYDGQAGSWLAYLVEVDGAEPVTFRWKGDLAAPWAAAKVPVTYAWQPLSRGIEIRFKRQAWQPGQLITFAARDQLIATIDKIQGRRITLSEAANRTAADAVVRHTDRAAIQRCISRAVRGKYHVFFPTGHYRIPGGLQVVKPAAIRIEGANAETTLLDISDGEGSCLHLSGGTEATIRNLSMVGHTGLAEAPRSFQTTSGYGFWPNSLKGCNAVGMSGTERVLIENVHARRMANECFYAQGPARAGTEEPRQYQKALTYLRCSVTDCAANAFNNNDRGENTSLLYCRVDGAGWHAAEMPARYLRVIGCYFRNTGPVTVGDMSHRYEDLDQLGCGQAIVADNVFEGIGRCGGVAVNHGSSQVVIANNLFINFNGPAITVSSHTVQPSLPWFKPDAPRDWGSFPSRSAIVRGNIIDLTYTAADARPRAGITVDASEVTVADNQVYVRGACDPRVTGILLREPALHLNVHDNLLRNCGTGLVTGRAGARVTQVVDARTFRQLGLPLEWRYTHQYQGWHLVWRRGQQEVGSSVIEAYDPASLCFKLVSPREMKVGDQFHVFPPGAANWLIHDNTITGCRHPMVLDSHGSETSVVRGNLIERGGVDVAGPAIDLRGRFTLTGNLLVGFAEPSPPRGAKP